MDQGSVVPYNDMNEILPGLILGNTIVLAVENVDCGYSSYWLSLLC